MKSMNEFHLVKKLIKNVLLLLNKCGNINFQIPTISLFHI